MTDNNNTPNGFNAMYQSLNNGPSNMASTNLHSHWSDSVNQERKSLIQEHPRTDQKVLGDFISNVFMKIVQNKPTITQGEEKTDDEWQAALLSELSALHEYYPSDFGVFAEFVSRIIRRASNNGQASSSHYRPLSNLDYRRGSSFFSYVRSGFTFMHTIFRYGNKASKSIPLTSHLDHNKMKVAINEHIKNINRSNQRTLQKISLLEKEISQVENEVYPTLIVSVHWLSF